MERSPLHPGRQPHKSPHPAGPTAEEASMASGYEKEACGADPADGWGSPSPTWDFILLLAALGFAAVHWTAQTLLLIYIVSMRFGG